MALDASDSLVCRFTPPLIDLLHLVATATKARRGGDRKSQKSNSNEDPYYYYKFSKGFLGRSSPRGFRHVLSPLLWFKSNTRLTASSIYLEIFYTITLANVKDFSS